MRKEFERSSECLEGAQARNAQAPRGKQHEVEEASNALLNARRGFRSEALDYVLQARPRWCWLTLGRLAQNRLQLLFPPLSDQRHRSQEEDGHRDGREWVLGPFAACSGCLDIHTCSSLPPWQMLSLMEAQSHFFQHGHQSLAELDQYRQKLSEEAGLLSPLGGQNEASRLTRGVGG